jgi:hypothetical protein
MNFTPQAFVIILALATAAVPVKSDDCSQLDYCGGPPQGDLGTQISCTPFPVKSTKLPPYQWQSYCDNEDVPKYAGSIMVLRRGNTKDRVLILIIGCSMVSTYTETELLF